MRHDATDASVRACGKWSQLGKHFVMFGIEKTYFYLATMNVQQIRGLVNELSLSTVNFVVSGAPRQRGCRNE